MTTLVCVGVTIMPVGGVGMTMLVGGDGGRRRIMLVGGNVETTTTLV
jgi:hypothetical protein